MDHKSSLWIKVQAAGFKAIVKLECSVFVVVLASLLRYVKACLSAPTNEWAWAAWLRRSLCAKIPLDRIL
jgi:hypothetical protein